MSRPKEKNVFKRYFANFGLKQICDMLMIAGAIVLLVALIMSGSVLDVSVLLLKIGTGIYIVASVLALVTTVKVLVGKTVHHRSPEYKRAIINTVVAGIILAVAVFGFVGAFAFPISA